MLVIFDCDGVLVDSEGLGNTALREALAELGLTLSAEETMERYLGRSRAHMLAHTQELYGAPLPSGWLAAYDARRDAAFARSLEAVPGVAAAIDAVEAAGHATCVASSGGHDRMRLTLGMTGLHERFAGRIFSATDVAEGKPAPDVFLHAAARMGFAPPDCVVVEDSEVGVAAARAAEMRVLHYGVEFTDMRELPGLVALPDDA